jgi:putative FmdB family regulatory protein
MPTYDFQCVNGHRFEHFQKMSDPAERSCPKCGSAATRQIGAGSGLVFKGSGFYLTDYGRDAHRNRGSGGA